MVGAVGPISQMKKLRLKEVKGFAQVPKDRKELGLESKSR